jgi:hypothetical protein
MPLISTLSNASSRGYRIFGAAGEINSYESIQTVNISSNTDIITFSSIPSTYKHLQLRAITRSAYSSTSVGASQYRILLNNDTGANYSFHSLTGNGASAFVNAGTSQTQIIADQPWSNPGGFGAGTIVSPVIIDILDYQNTNKNKTVRMYQAFNANSTSTNQFITLRSGAWYSTSAVTSIVLDATTGPFSDGPFAANTQWALYGIKG